MRQKNFSLTLEEGFTILEVVFIIAIIATLLTIASLNSDFLNQNRLPAASRQLYSDLQKARQDALTKGTPGINSLGYGIILTSGNSYTTFEFNDSNSNFTYDGSGEQSGPVVRNLPAPITVTVNPTANNVLLYDRKGIARGTNWTAAGTTSYVLTGSTSSQSRCVRVDATSIREGIWNGTICSIQ